MKETLHSVRNYCEFLKTDADREAEAAKKEDGEEDEEEEEVMPAVAPGVKEDLERHKGEEICIDPVLVDSSYSPPKPVSLGVRVISDEDTSLRTASDERDSSDDDVVITAKN